MYVGRCILPIPISRCLSIKWFAILGVYINTWAVWYPWWWWWSPVDAFYRMPKHRLKLPVNCTHRSIQGYLTLSLPHSLSGSVSLTLPFYPLHGILSITRLPPFAMIVRSATIPIGITLAAISDRRSRCPSIGVYIDAFPFLSSHSQGSLSFSLSLLLSQ